MCWAESLALIGMPFDRSRASAAKRRKSSTLREVAYLGDAPDNFRAGQVTTGSGLRALAELEVERLHLLEHIPRPSEARRRELIEVARVLGLLLRQHATFTRTDPRTRELRAPRQRGLRLLRQCAERHVGHEHPDVEEKRLPRVRSDAHFGADRNIIEERKSRKLRRDKLDRIPTRDRLNAGTPIAATKPWWPTFSSPCSASSWMRITYGSSIVPCGSVYSP